MNTFMKNVSMLAVAACAGMSITSCTADKDLYNPEVVEENVKAEYVANFVKKFGADAKDTGSAEVQIAMLTQKISELTEHMKSNKKDFATKRGLLMMVGKRRNLLAYLKEKDIERYRNLIARLNLRK